MPPDSDPSLSTRRCRPTRPKRPWPRFRRRSTAFVAAVPCRHRRGARQDPGQEDADTSWALGDKRRRYARHRRDGAFRHPRGLLGQLRGSRSGADTGRCRGSGRSRAPAESHGLGRRRRPRQIEAGISPISISARYGSSMPTAIPQAIDTHWSVDLELRRRLVASLRRSAVAGLCSPIRP